MCILRLVYFVYWWLEWLKLLFFLVKLNVVLSKFKRLINWVIFFNIFNLNLLIFLGILLNLLGFCIKKDELWILGFFLW